MKTSGLVDTGEFVRSVVDWFVANGRTFPWRSEADPYRIAVAEIMLQKTSARAVLNVYPAFIAEFPTSRHVVEDSVGRVEELLRPLGLLGRSTTIRALCEAIVRQWGGAVPADEESLVAVRGLGSYTAKSILCHAYGRQDLPVDINVARIVSRYFAIPFKKEHRHIPKVIAEFCGSLPLSDRAREVVYGLIDLGAHVCTSRRPRCGVCPLALRCAARQASERETVDEGA